MKAVFFYFEKKRRVDGASRGKYVALLKDVTKESFQNCKLHSGLRDGNQRVGGS